VSPLAPTTQYDRVAVARHEAAHAAACVLLGVEVECVRIDRPEHNMAGWCIAPRDGIGKRDVLIQLAGYMCAGTEGWPPAWPVDEDELEALGVLVRFLELDERQYHALIRRTEEMIASREFRRIADLIERALTRVLVLDKEQLEYLLNGESK